MNRWRVAAVAVIVACLAAALWQSRRRGGAHSVRQTTVLPAPAPRSGQASPAPAKGQASPPVTPPPPVQPPKPAPLPPPVAPAEGGLHTELIPRGISILRCHYSQDVIGPGGAMTIFINGSGFTQDFQQRLKLDPGAASITVKGLQLVTANQLKADVQISPDAKTQRAYPRVLIQGLPVFEADNPLALVRVGDVLSVEVIEIGQDGRSAKFRAITNLADENMARQFWVESNVDGMDVTGLEPKLPYYVEGKLLLHGAKYGKYGVIVSVFSREKLRVDDLGLVVPPNLGRRGRTQKVVALQRYLRPGDKARFKLIGHGFEPRDHESISARPDGFKAGRAAFTYVSPNQIDFTLDLPPAAPVGTFGTVIEGPDDKLIQQDGQVFTIVPPEWIGAIDVAPSPAPGARCQFKLTGRDFNAASPAKLKLEFDEPGIQLSPLRFVDPTTLAADLSIAPAVAKGEYWVHISQGGAAVVPPAGTVITVN